MTPKLLTVQQFAMRCLIDKGLAQKGWTFGWRRRNDNILGTCDSTWKTLQVSLGYANLNPLSNVQDTVLHEIAHALDYELSGNSSHDEQWKAHAESVGAVPQATTTNIRFRGWLTWCPECKSENLCRKMPRDGGILCKCGEPLPRHYWTRCNKAG